MGPDEFTRLFCQLAESTPDVIYLFTADWDDVVFLNEAYEEIWGQSAKAVQADPEDFLDGIYPDHRGKVRNAMDRISAGESVDIDTHGHKYLNTSGGLSRSSAASAAS